MKKKILLIVAIALVGTVTLTLNSLRAQNDAAPSAPPAGQSPPPSFRPGPPPGLRGRPGNRYLNAIMVLKMVKTDLERSTDDFDGHRQSAMDACEKAMKELQAVEASVRATAAAKAAAAQQAPAQAAPQAPPAAAAPPQ